jgi:hypothetical protein
MSEASDVIGLLDAPLDDDRKPAPLLRPSECPYEAPR